MSNKFKEWTADELLAEVRGRERARVAAAMGMSGPKGVGGARSVGDPDVGVVARFHNLNELSDAELAALVKDRQRAIYGSDNRQDTYLVKNKATLALAEASVALVAKKDLEATATGWTLKTTSYRTAYNLCADEPFASQPLGCFCSGVLVRPDVIATAGHCVKNAAELATMRFVFGFRMLAGTPVQARVSFANDDVYAGNKLIARRFTPDGTDWALVQLDRPVVGRKPVALRTTGKISTKDRLLVIGHPCGLPQKCAGDARVSNNTPASHFAATLDTYGGNSGSPVFNDKSFKLEGLLVRGQTDFISNGTCNVSAVFPTTGSSGEDVTRTSEWSASLGSGSGPAAANAGDAASAAGGAKRRKAAKQKPKAKAKRARSRSR